MPPSAKVVVVGSIMQDLTLACAEFPTSGQTIVGRLSVGQGGKGSNQAIACDRAGVPTLFVGAMGRDSVAAQAEKFYRTEKIACHIVKKAGAASGTAVILLNRAGQNEIVIAPGANALLAPADVPLAALRRAAVVLTQLESSLATTAHVLRAARRAGVTTMLNPAPMREDFATALLADVDILIPNESEFVALVRGWPRLKRRAFDETKLRALSHDALHALCRELGVPTIIVTMGGQGCFVSEAHGYFFLPAHRGIKVEDTTGAGDAFCGGFAAGLVRTGGDITAAARFGTTVAALSITKPGAASAMPKLAEVLRFDRRALRRSSEDEASAAAR
ncbi:MAG: ribokinase [Opitutus sp.]|nr:ribokinase [Opitutus sp.]